MKISILEVQVGALWLVHISDLYVNVYLETNDEFPNFVRRHKTFQRIDKINESKCQ